MNDFGKTKVVDLHQILADADKHTEERFASIIKQTTEAQESLRNARAAIEHSNRILGFIVQASVIVAALLAVALLRL